MERYKAKKLAESVGLIFVGGDPVGDHFVDKMTQFASLVEQETLERAAKVCDSHLDFKEQEKADDAAWKSNKESIDVQIARFRHASDVRLYNCGIEKCIESIRDLKGNHDKE